MNRSQEKKDRILRAKKRDAERAKMSNAQNWLQHMAQIFPNFIGKVCGGYTMVSRLEEHLVARGIDPEHTIIESMTADSEAKTFTAVMKPKPENSFMMITHIGVEVRGVKNGVQFSVEDICRHLSKPGQEVRAEQFKSVSPAENGMVYLELTVPRVVSTPVPEEELVKALNATCESADTTVTKEAAEAARAYLVTRIRYWQSKGKNTVEIEELTKNERAEVIRLDKEAEDESRGIKLTPDTIIDHGAPLAGDEDLTCDEIVTRVQTFAKARLEWARGNGEKPMVTKADLYGTSPGVAPGKALQGTDKPGVIVGLAVETALLDAGWHGVTVDSPLQENGKAVEWTVWIYPEKKAMLTLVPDEEPAAEKAEEPVLAPGDTP